MHVAGYRAKQAERTIQYPVPGIRFAGWNSSRVSAER
jgi:hypothetical protein